MKNTGKTLNTITSLLILALSGGAATAAVPSSLFSNINGERASSEQNIQNWQKFYPGLEDKIQQAFRHGEETGTFLLHSSMAPVAWSITNQNNIVINSINVGYFLTVRDPNTYRPLFKDLSPESLNVAISAENDLIAVPTSTELNGFGYALSVNPNQKAEISAGNQIIFMSPVTGTQPSYYDEISAALSDNAQANLRAREILMFEGVLLNYQSLLNLDADSGIYFLNSHERGLGSNSAVIRLSGGTMSVNAPAVYFNQEVIVGWTLFDTHFPSSLYIGSQPGKAGTVNNVYFNKPVNLEASSDLEINAENNVVFAESLNLIFQSKARISAKSIKLDKLFLGNLGASADFNVYEGGTMAVTEPVKVGSASQLNINLSRGASLFGAVSTSDRGSSSLSMEENSFWYPTESSSLTSLNLRPNSYIQLGASGSGSGKKREVETDKLAGNGGNFFLPSGANGSLKINKSSEGSHRVLLSSTGQSLENTKYVYHIAAKDYSPDGSDKAAFSLANDGIVDAGPYEYKLGLYQFKKDDARYWVILGSQNLKPKPDEPDQPDNPNPDQPDNPNPDHPDNPNPDQPDNPNPDQPDNPNPDQPDNPNPDQPDNPNPDQPDNPNPDQPDNPNPDQPDNPNPDQPDNPNPDHPDNPNPDQPDNPDEPTPPEVIPKPELPPLPFDPENPPVIDGGSIRPVGLSPSAKLTLASVASANQVFQLLGSLDDLRGRLGEVRSGAADGLYALYRFDKNRFQPSDSFGSKGKFSTYTLGLDHKVDANWILGGNLTVSNSKIEISGSDSETKGKSVGLKLYAVWVGEKGSYLDAVLYANRYKNKLSIEQRDESRIHGSFHDYGYGASIEAGHSFRFPVGSASDNWFVEPQAQLSYYRIQGKNFNLSSGMRIKVKSGNSLNGRLGFVAGRSFSGYSDAARGQVYLRTGVQHEFMGKTKVAMNEFDFKSNSLGTRVYYGVGADFNYAQRLKIYGQINRESGSRLKTDFQLKFGVKYSF